MIKTTFVNGVNPFFPPLVPVEPPPPKDTSEFDELTRQVLWFMRADYLNINALVMALGVGTSPIRRAQKALLAKGLIHLIGQGGAKRYRVTELGRSANHLAATPTTFS